jgi:hypothetical protein
MGPDFRPWNIFLNSFMSWTINFSRMVNQKNVDPVDGKISPLTLGLRWTHNSTPSPAGGAATAIFVRFYQYPQGFIAIFELKIRDFQILLESKQLGDKLHGI